MNLGTPAWSDKYQCAEWPLFNGLQDAMAFGNHEADYGWTRFEEDVVRELKRAYRYCFRSDLNLGQGVEKARAELLMLPDVQHFLDFIEASQRGVGF